MNIGVRAVIISFKKSPVVLSSRTFFIVATTKSLHLLKRCKLCKYIGLQVVVFFSTAVPAVHAKSGAEATAQTFTVFSISVQQLFSNSNYTTTVQVLKAPRPQQQEPNKIANRLIISESMSRLLIIISIECWLYKNFPV